MNKLTAQQFFDEVCKHLKDNYSLEPGDIDFTLEKAEYYCTQSETPEEYVQWVGNKYGLTPISEMNLERAVSIFKSIQK